MKIHSLLKNKDLSASIGFGGAVPNTSAPRKWRFGPHAPPFSVRKTRSRIRKVFLGLTRQRLADPDRQKALHRMGRELGILAGETEGEFLALGENLQDFYRRAAAISKISSSVAHLMGGEGIATVIDGFRRLIGDVERLEAESRRNAVTLEDLLYSIAQLLSNLAGFRNIVRTLRVLGVYTRIESARLGEQDIGFQVLADEVMKLAAEIDEQYSHLLVEAESLRQIVEQTLARVADLEHRRQARAGVVLDETLASLEPLLEKQRLSSAIAATISRRYEDISRNVGDIVASMQFHDITRQRIEHAQQALDNIADDSPAPLAVGEEQDAVPEGARTACAMPRQQCSNLISKMRMKFFATARQPWHLAADVCELQTVQLKSARDIVVNAVENIVAKLDDIAGIVTAMTQETREMAGAADTTGSSCFSELEAAFASVTSALDAYAETDQELSLIMRSMGRTLKDMASFAVTIEGIGERIKRLALNAIVKASHIGDMGQTLGVLADSVHELAVETRGRTESVTDVLRSMAGGTELHTEGGGPAAVDSPTGLDNINTMVGTLLTKVQQVNQEIAALLGQMEEAGSNLSDTILEVLATVTVHHRFDSEIGSVVSRLEAIVADARPLHSTADSSETGDRLQALEDVYTMQEERRVHQSLMAAQTPDSMPELFSATDGTEPAGRPDSGGEAAGEHLGDNVELF